MTYFTSAFTILMIMYAAFFSFIFLFWLDVPGKKRYQLFKFKFPKRKLLKLCGVHASKLKPGRMALLDSNNCEKCSKKKLTNK